MTAKIQQHRGLEIDLPILAEGQIGFTTDTKRIFIGSKDGNIEITNEIDFKAIKQSLDEGTKELAQKVDKSSKSTSAQAQAGTNDDTYMTPLKVKDAISSLTNKIGIMPEDSYYTDTLPKEYPLGKTFFFSFNAPENRRFNNMTYCGVETLMYYKRNSNQQMGVQFIYPYSTSSTGIVSYYRYAQYSSSTGDTTWGTWKTLGDFHSNGSVPIENITIGSRKANSTIGTNSFAQGNTVESSGSYSHAEGSNTKATAISAHAEGGGTTASNNNAHAEGDNTTSSGLASHAEGYMTVAIGNYSHAEGAGSQAVSYASHAEGSNTTAGGTSSHSEGDGTVANTRCSHAEGEHTLASNGILYKVVSVNATNNKLVLDSVSGLTTSTSVDIKRNSVKAVSDAKITNIDTNTLTITVDTTTAITGASHVVVKHSGAVHPTHAEGRNSIATGNMSHAQGNSSVASGESSHAEGQNSQASGSRSHAEGYFTLASNNQAHAEGSTTTASGINSHAEGVLSVASGSSAHAEGNNSTASGSSAHAEGYKTVASGDNSHAEGYCTSAEDNASHASGVYNKEMTGSNNTFKVANTALVIGNGTGETARSNAFRVMFNGSTYGLSAFNSTGADYAEFFEWIDGNLDGEDRVGYVVALDGEKIRLASEGDEILGVISANPSVIGDSYQDDWQGRYELDKWGRKIVEEYEYEETLIEEEEYEETYTETITEYVEEEQIETYLDDEGEEQQNVIKVEVPVESEVTRTEMFTRPKEVKVIRKGTRFKENVEWNNESEYIPREQRKEWDAVGLIGKLLVRTDGTLKVNEFAKVGNNGVLTHSDEKTNIQVMSIIDNDIARVFIK